MTSPLSGIDDDVREVLFRIVSRFLNRCEGTSVREVRTKLLKKRSQLDDLVTLRYLKDDIGRYIPTIRLIAEINPEIRGLGFAVLNAALAAVRNLYIRNQHTNEFSFQDIVNEVRRMSPTLDGKDVLPGLFLAMDLGYFGGWNSPSAGGEQLTLASIYVTEGIIDFESAEACWNALSVEGEFRAQKSPGLDAVDSTDLTVDLSFVSNRALLRIIARDYAELRAIPHSAIKSRIIIAGGLIEALLLDRLLTREVKASLAVGAERKGKNGEVKPIDEWHLSALIQVGRELGEISEDASKHSLTIREYRNLVHPGLEKRGTIQVRENVANIALEVLAMVIADLRAGATKTSSK